MQVKIIVENNTQKENILLVGSSSSILFFLTFHHTNVRCAYVFVCVCVCRWTRAHVFASNTYMNCVVCSTPSCISTIADSCDSVRCDLSMCCYIHGACFAMLSIDKFDKTLFMWIAAYIFGKRLFDIRNERQRPTQTYTEFGKAKPILFLTWRTLWTACSVISFYGLNDEKKANVCQFFLTSKFLWVSISKAATKNNVQKVHGE